MLPNEETCSAIVRANKKISEKTIKRDCLYRCMGNLENGRPEEEKILDRLHKCQVKERSLITLDPKTVSMEMERPRGRQTRSCSGNIRTWGTGVTLTSLVAISGNSPGLEAKGPWGTPWGYH
jgi:hypothetical protein